MFPPRWLLYCTLVFAAPTASAQISVVGPSFAALSVPDLPASMKWYGEIFGLAKVFEAYAPDSSTHVVLLANAGVRVELVWHQGAQSLEAYAGKPTPPDLVYGSAKIGFFVPDLDRAIAVLKTHNATIEGSWLIKPSHVASTDSLWTRNILVRDNSGNYVQFFEKKP